MQGHCARMREAGNGFIDHGVATPVSNHRGIAVTVDGDGRNVVLVWLFDHRGGYALLVIDADTGRSVEYPMPFQVRGDCPFASLLSSRNRFYTHFDSHFVEFDPGRREFTFEHVTAPQMAMGMTEDDRGRIWSVTYPNSGVVVFDPASRAFRDYGPVYQQNWAQYQRYVAADDSDWIYFGIGNTASQIIAFDPASGKATPILPESERVTGSGSVYRDLDGKVYGQAGGTADWYELYRGGATRLDKQPPRQPKPIITGSQSLCHVDFPDGKRMQHCDLVTRKLKIVDPRTGVVQTRSFRYSSDGAHIMGVAVAPDGTICGGTAFPMRFFSYAPRTNTWKNRDTYCQCNTVVQQGDRFFVGGYTAGFVLEWDPARPWVKTRKGSSRSNPLYLIDCKPDIYRPHALLAHPDGKTLVMSGTPDYGYTGGGVLFWDRALRKGTLVPHTAILPEHSTMSLLALPDGKLMGGSTTDPGTGGERKARQAELYIMDMATKTIEWHSAVLPGVNGYTNLCPGRNGMVYGIADTSRFFVFDPGRRVVVHEENTDARFGPIGYQQGHRKFVTAPDGTVYILFQKGIARVNQDTFGLTLIAESPVPVTFGGDILDGRIYFGSGSHLYSVKVQ